MLVNIIRRYIKDISLEEGVTLLHLRAAAWLCESGTVKNLLLTYHYLGSPTVSVIFTGLNVVRGGLSGIVRLMMKSGLFFIWKMLRRLNFGNVFLCIIYVTVFLEGTVITFWYLAFNLDRKNPMFWELLGPACFISYEAGTHASVFLWLTLFYLYLLLPTVILSSVTFWWDFVWSLDFFRNLYFAAM